MRLALSPLASIQPILTLVSAMSASPWLMSRKIGASRSDQAMRRCMNVGLSRFPSMTETNDLSELPGSTTTFEIIAAVVE